MSTPLGPTGRSRGLDLVLAALDASLDRTKAALAVLLLVLAGGSGFVVLLLASVMGDPAFVVALLAIWLMAMWLLNALVFGAITRLAHSSMADRVDESLGDAVEFARRHLLSFALAPLLPVALAAAVLGAEVLALQVHRLPAIGELAMAAVFLPLVLVNMVVCAGVIVGLWLVPAEIAATGDGPVRAVRTVMRTLADVPGRLLIHFAATVAVVVVVGVMLSGLLWAAVTQTLALAAWAGGDAAQAGGIVAMVAELGLSGFPEGGEADVLTVATLLVYVLYASILVAVVILIPLYVFPLCAACAAWIDAIGAAPDD